jgi:H+-translocating NAD(P) transhydrogenase subunit beta
MSYSLLTVIYLIASVTFILGLKMLSHPESARRGNLVAAGGMFIAIVGTIFLYEDLDTGERLHNYGWIFGGLMIGGIIGTLIAKRVKMTAMPEMVSLFNGMGGACAALISIAEFNHFALLPQTLRITSASRTLVTGNLTSTASNFHCRPELWQPFFSA